MPVDIRATVACSLGTVISGNVNDEYVQGTGLIKFSGTVVINGIITPAIGTAVTFTYTKSGVTRSIPRKLRVLSSFADPFRRTTSVELGCKLTYLSDKRDSIDWTAFDDDENTLTEADAEIITIPIRAQAVAKKCMDELGISGTFTLTNKFSVAEFDLSPGYVQVLSDLLVSESLCGYLDANEVLQVFSLDQPGGTGPVLDATQLVDVSKIGVGQLPGEAVVVSYSSLKLKQDVNQGEEGGESPWDKEINQSRYYVDIPYGAPADGAFGTRRYNILEKTITTTTYRQLVTQAGETRRVVGSRWTDFTTSSPAVAGGLISEYLANGIGYFSRQILKQTFEDYEYDADGLERRYTRLVRGSFLFLAGSAGVPFVFGDSHVSINDSLTVNLEKEERITVTSGDRQLVQTTVWAPWFKSIAGQQSISRAFPSFTSTSDVIGYLNTIASDSLAIIDKRSEIRQTSQPESAPSGADINNATNAKGGNAGNGYRTESKAELALALGSATAQRRIELSLPYAPDDVFTKAGSTYGSAASDAAAKAQLYGRVQNRLLLGNRNGMNLQCAPEILPGAPFAPFIVKSGSTSALYRTNGTNWTFDAQGLVASTDALFWGGIGGNAGESWFPIAPGITTLPTAPATTTVNITDASGNVISSYQQMVVTGTVPIAQETALLQATLRLRPVVTSLPYALQETVEVAITTRLRAVVSSIKVVNVPAATVTVAGLAPKVSTGVRVLVPAASLAIEALVPVVASGASVAVPAAGIAVAGLVPELVGRPKTIVAGPAAEITVAGLAPVVSSGASVLVPVADVVLAGLVPQSIGGPVDPSFLSVQLLLHMNGSNGSTTFTDNSSAARTVTPSGNAQISTAQSKFGGASGYFDGAGDYLTASVTGGLGSGDFTLEFWYYKTANSGMLFNSRTSGTSANGFDIRHDLQVSTDQVFLFTAATVSTNQWVHVAITRSGTTLRRFINGTLNGSATASTNYSGTDFKIGGSPHGNTGYLTGYMDDVRVTVGVARYTASFTAPTAQFADR